MSTERQRDQKWVEEQRWVNEVRATVQGKVRAFQRREGLNCATDLLRWGTVITTIDANGDLTRVDPASLTHPFKPV